MLGIRGIHGSVWIDFGQIQDPIQSNLIGLV